MANSTLKLTSDQTQLLQQMRSTTLFNSDVRSRLAHLFRREGFPKQEHRPLRRVQELTSRLSQAKVVEIMDHLAVPFSASNDAAIDACLASSIIEVGVDIDRLSLMAVIGQPKTTAQYIQVTGRVGRRWWERPGLILTIFNPSKSRDRSHFEQFQSYHRRLYQRVEPTTATPFALATIKRALPGALLTWVRQHSSAPVDDFDAYEDALNEGYAMLCKRCESVQLKEDQARSLEELESVQQELVAKAL